MVLAGYFLRENQWVKHNFEKIVIGIVLVTTGPVIIKMFFGKKKSPIQEVSEDVVEEVFTSSDKK